MFIIGVKGNVENMIQCSRLLNTIKKYLCYIIEFITLRYMEVLGQVGREGRLSEMIVWN